MRGARLTVGITPARRGVPTRDRCRLAGDRRTSSTPRDGPTGRRRSAPPRACASEFAALVMARDVVDRRGGRARASGTRRASWWSATARWSRSSSARCTPSIRRRGIGTALLRQTRDGTVARMAADPRPLPRELRATRSTARPGSSRCSRPRGSRPSGSATRCVGHSAAICRRTRCRRASSCGRWSRRTSAPSSTPTRRRSSTTGATGRPPRRTSARCATGRT